PHSTSSLSTSYSLRSSTTSFFLFFFNTPPPTEIYTLSLHDALPISKNVRDRHVDVHRAVERSIFSRVGDVAIRSNQCRGSSYCRSEEHTSELQSRFDLVCRLLLEKKKKKNNSIRII